MPSREISATRETIEDAFVHPFIETVIGADGKKFYRTINICRDRVKDYIEGKTPCIMTDDGVPLALARQEAYMKHLESIGEILVRRGRI